MDDLKIKKIASEMNIELTPLTYQFVKRIIQEQSLEFNAKLIGNDIQMLKNVREMSEMMESQRKLYMSQMKKFSNLSQTMVS